MLLGRTRVPTEEAVDIHVTGARARLALVADTIVEGERAHRTQPASPMGLLQSLLWASVLGLWSAVWFGFGDAAMSDLGSMLAWVGGAFVVVLGVRLALWRWCSPTWRRVLTATFPVLFLVVWFGQSWLRVEQARDVDAAAYALLRDEPLLSVVPGGAAEPEVSSVAPCSGNDIFGPRPGASGSSYSTTTQSPEQVMDFYAARLRDAGFADVVVGTPPGAGVPEGALVVGGHRTVDGHVQHASVSAEPTDATEPPPETTIWIEIWSPWAFDCMWFF